MSDKPTEKIVIQEFPGEGHKAITRARLLAATSQIFPPDRRRPHPDDDLTTAGKELLPALAAIDGMQITVIYRHGILYRPYHPALWSWDGIDRAVIGAFRRLLGVDELEVIRETGGNGSPDSD